MSQASDAAPVPRAEVRRFDVFAEYNRIKNRQKGLSEDLAKGDAIWLAKLVAARRFARSPEARAAVNEALGKGRRAPEEEERPRGPREFRELSGQPQTDELFDREVVARMGPDFYHDVFAPAIAEAFERHQRYEDIRDRIRAPWNRRRQAAA